MLVEFVFFLVSLILLIFSPGLLLIGKTKINLNFFEETVLSLNLGLIIFTLISYIFLLFNLQILSFILGISSVFVLRPYIERLKRSKISNLRSLLAALTVFGIGILGQLAIISPSGIIKDGDLIFWSAHGHDGPWHIALMEEMNKGFPLQNPVFAGEKLVNYHLFSDIAPAFFYKYFSLDPLNLYFRFFPLLYSILLGSTAFILGQKICRSFSAGVWAAFFTYFAGSFGYIVTLMQNRGLGGEGVFWSSQVQSTIGNPPQIVASILVLTVFIFFYHFIKERSKYLLFLLILLLGILPVFKIYAGVVVFLSLGVISLVQLIKDKSFHFFKILAPGGILAASLYFPNSSQSQSFLIFEPWWFIRTMVVSSDKLNWLDLELRRQTYIYEDNWKRVIQLEVTAFMIFLFGNLGTRFIAFWYFVKNFKKVLTDYLHLFLILTIFISFLLPLLFLQKGVASNTIQFLQYFLLLLGIVAGLSLASVFQKLNIFSKIIVSLIIIILSVPTQVGLIYDFYKNPPTSKISKNELEALKYLSQNTPPDSTLLAPPYNPYLDLKNSPPSIWDWFDTSYVAAFSKRRTFLADIEQVDIMGYKYNLRYEVQKEVFQNEKIDYLNLLKTNNINYLYFPKVLKPKFKIENSALNKVYENAEVEIWKVN